MSFRYERFVDFAQLIRLDRGAESDYFQLTHVPHLGGLFFLSAKGALVDMSVRFSNEEMLELRSLLDSIFAEVEHARVFSLLELRYGSV